MAGAEPQLATGTRLATRSLCSSFLRQPQQQRLRHRLPRRPVAPDSGLTWRSLSSFLSRLSCRRSSRSFIVPGIAGKKERIRVGYSLVFASQSTARDWNKRHTRRPRARHGKVRIRTLGHTLFSRRRRRFPRPIQTFLLFLFSLSLSLSLLSRLRTQALWPAARRHLNHFSDSRLRMQFALSPRFVHSLSLTLLLSPFPGFLLLVSSHPSPGRRRATAAASVAVCVSRT